MNSETNISSLKAKIDALNKEAWETRVNDSNRSMKMSQESLQLAKSINYPKGIAEGLRNIGFCHIRLAKNDEAAPLLNEAFSIFESINDKTGQALVYEYLSIIRRNKGDLGGSLELLFKALPLTEPTPLDENHATHYYQLGVTYKHLGDFESALEYFYRSIAVCKVINNPLYEAYSINLIGSIYFETGDYSKALDYFLQGLPMREAGGDKWGIAGSLDNIGFTYLKLQNFDKAVEYCSRSLEISKSTGDIKGQANVLRHLAEIYKQQGDYKKSVQFCNESLELYKSGIEKKGESEIYLFLAELHRSGTSKVNDEELEFILKANKIAEDIKAVDLLSKTRFALYNYYKRAENHSEAIKNLELHINLEKESHKKAIDQKISNLEITHKAEEAKKEAEAVRLQNEELTKLNKEIEEQKNRLVITLAELKATQAQLIQSEKMASLGELTAGIAHEIQNPLNFVNNFSEINTELIQELKESLEAGDYEMSKKVAADINANEEKINHHGKRADAIVKNMLQHSRSSSGKKEATDINALTDEYLRLAYHGLRARDKSFNATMKTDFDDSIGKINIIPQDIGRVILNLINNAFYAVDEKKKKTLRQAQGDGYEPTVSVSTKGNNGKVEIKVGDNGNGIPPKVLDKIFQPFFTTKPTGQGTGLGLSLSYDIVKAHGGELKVETKEGKGAEFIIELPAADN